MLKNDSPDKPLVAWTHVIGMCLSGFKSICIQPVFGFCISLLTVNMNGFATLIGIEESLAHDQEYGRHFKSAF